ncbi:ubiquitin carboxyl-terminal hydrolase 16 isoform X2 [Lampris incognitus]|uniref:ubiquitin carboxyl-terminal hydrolase 16 isoform X2 n=1 Tax=Lampris incognitus TaxID=2546036 RepID=UPI0024B48C90|nr:ubiquitin carboxyl-terminal hydrolase 16 isoform X2 [Lampris incognitus]
MGKKRGKDASSREDDDTDLTDPSCRHTKKGIDRSFLKKCGESSNWTICQDCKNDELTSPAVPQECEDEKETPAIWMCLKCGHRGCGRNSDNQHAVKHSETLRSDPHCLVVSMDNWSVWCYLCDDDVQYSKSGQLAQLVASIKKQVLSSPETRKQQRNEILLEEEQMTRTTMDEENREGSENEENQKKNVRKADVMKSQKNGTNEGSRAVIVKGLSNLGNTCFFNAVIQNLSQTQLLRQILSNVTEDRNSLDIMPGAPSNLEPIVVQLDQPGSLTLAMCQLLNEIQESKKSVVTPRELFTQICKKAARFKGFQQQDSQELLRYLLDGMRAEEMKRVSAGILEALKKSGKTVDEEQLKALIKEYEKNGFPKNCVDQVFGGEMTSTVMCQQCQTVSLVTEMFLDLSLPVSDEAYRKRKPKKGAQNTSESSQDGGESLSLINGHDLPTGAGSKYQQKKAKKQAKKQAKNQRRQQKFEGKVTLDSITALSPVENTQADPTNSHVVENADDETFEEAPTSEINPMVMSLPKKDKDDLDAVQNSREKEEEEHSFNECDSSGTSAVNNRFTVLSEDKKNSFEDENTSDLDQEVEEDTLLVGDMEKISLNDGFIEDFDPAEQGKESEEMPMEAKGYTVVNQDPELAFRTLAMRVTPEKQECSVQSCLFQFTEVENLTENNSLLCVSCTKRQSNNKDSQGSKKNVYTDAVKQILVSSPPSVLTLHLKRFQQTGYSICKVNRHVQFPQVLDLAPFCALNCKNVTEGDAQVLYSLYGIVEHSGTMRSGHYTAYVKVRPQGPTSTANGLAAQGGGDIEPPKGSWFHISDTSVQPVTESKVQSSQAYLLFYERIC